jgi:hypothetical protein
MIIWTSLNHQKWWMFVHQRFVCNWNIHLIRSFRDPICFFFSVSHVLIFLSCALGAALRHCFYLFTFESLVIYNPKKRWFLGVLRMAVFLITLIFLSPCLEVTFSLLVFLSTENVFIYSFFEVTGFLISVYYREWWKHVRLHLCWECYSCPYLCRRSFRFSDGLCGWKGMPMPKLWMFLSIHSFKFFFFVLFIYARS